MSADTSFSRGEGGGAAGDRKAAVEAKLEALFAKRKATPSEELAGPQDFWDLYAVGPYQSWDLEPSRVIEVDEEATIGVVVYLNDLYPIPAPVQNACDIITGFGACIELNFFTSNMQTMQPAPQLSHHYCIPTTPGQCWYYYEWTFKPSTAACLYETNICARICNCKGEAVRQYSGFVRWVEDWEYDWIFGEFSSYTFDHPIRFAVFDYKGQDDCCPDCK
jgi:hypothetical protein